MGGLGGGVEGDIHDWAAEVVEGLQCNSWHPTDRSVKQIFVPWQEVFSCGLLCAFLIKNIVPKLDEALDNLSITPHIQDLTHWRAVTY